MRVLMLGLCCAVLLAIAGCGVRSSGVINGVPAPATQVNGVVLYLVAEGRPTLVIRQSTVEPSVAEAVELLAAGPTAWERSLGLTSEVPSDAVPASVGAPGSNITVTLSTNVSALSTVAAEQIACTVDVGTPVTLEGAGERRGPVTCRVHGDLVQGPPQPPR